MGVVAWDRARGWARTRGKPIPPQLPCPHLPLLNGGVGLAVVLLLLVLPVQALSFPWWPQQGRGQPTSELAATSPLQEVAPSAAVQQLRQALDEHQGSLGDPAAVEVSASGQLAQVMLLLVISYSN